MGKIVIPKTIINVVEKLKASRFEVFVVGGCVRDFLRDVQPVDWDLTTNAKPEEILEIFPDGKYENDFGTVLLPEKYFGDENSKGIIELTTYRIESNYSDKRHPDKIQFAKTLKEDLSRRDFTVNALALDLKVEKSKEISYELIDLFEGQNDLENKIIRSVGDPSERFNEDALRMMRAIRFVSSLDFEIEEKTAEAIIQNATNLKFVSKERIRDELVKLICGKNPAKGINLCLKLGLMAYIIPEVLASVGVKQNRHHYYGPFNTVYEHMLASLQKCPSEKFEVRFAAFLHDIGKPKTKEGKGEQATFHGHEYVGARMVKKIMHRLKFSKKVIEKTVLLVKSHMFYYNVDEVGEAGVRRVVRRVGLENIKDLIDVRIGDRLGSGVPKAVPYKLRHFKYMVEKVSKDPISVKQLKIDGGDLISELEMIPGPKIGAILDVLLSRVIDEPKLNEKEKLLNLAKKLQEEDLEGLREMAKEKIKEKQKKEDRKTKEKYWVK